MSESIIRIRVPATSANLGAGFDTLGMALSLYNVVTIKRFMPPGEFLSVATGEGAKELSNWKSNLIIDSYLEACLAWRIKEPKGFEIHSDNAIPLCRGLGSSASAVVSGVLIAREIYGIEASESDLLHIMTRIEGHPDNVAPCFLGGMTVGCWDGNDLRYIRLPSLPADMYVVVAVPDFNVKTTDARKSLPEMVNFSDAVFNLGRSALMAAAWATGQWDMLSWGMDDRLHQQYRSKLFPGGEVIMDRVRAIPGCLGVAISGSGPSVLALSLGKPREIAETMCRTFSDHGIKSLFFVLEGNAVGAKIEVKL